MPIAQSSVPPQPTPDPCSNYSQEDDLTKECKSLISSLPKEQGWIFSYVYLYQGFWYPSKHLQGMLPCQNHFIARDTDLILSTTPKSGTTWLKALLYALLNRASKSLVGLDHPLLRSNPHDLVPFLELTLYAGRQVPDLTTWPSPRVFSTHTPSGCLPRSVTETQRTHSSLCGTLQTR